MVSRSRSSEVGLGKDSVINVTHLATIDKRHLGTPVGWLALSQLEQLDNGLRLVLGMLS